MGRFYGLTAETHGQESRSTEADGLTAETHRQAGRPGHFSYPFLPRGLRAPFHSPGIVCAGHADEPEEGAQAMDL